MFLIDGHCDSAMKLTSEAISKGGTGHLDFPRMSEVVNLQFFAFFLNATKNQDLYAEILPRMKEFIATAEDNHFNILKQASDLINLPNGKNILLAVEGADVFAGNFNRVEEFYNLGLRAVGLTWNNNNWAAGGCGENNQGLTHAGYDLIDQLNGLGVIIDLAHASRQTFQDVVERSNKPLIVSHTCCDAVHNFRERNINDKEIKMLAEIGGTVGITFVPDFLASEDAEISDIASHLRHLINKGGVELPAFGSDFDGVDNLPQGIEGVESYPHLIDRLSGYFTSWELEYICFKNLKRVIEDVL